MLATYLLLKTVPIRVECYVIEDSKSLVCI